MVVLFAAVRLDWSVSEVAPAWIIYMQRGRQLCAHLDSVGSLREGVCERACAFSQTIRRVKLCEVVMAIGDFRQHIA